MKPLAALVRAAIALAIGLTTLGAYAQAVYRCGNAYAQEPCPQARRTDVADERSDAQRAEARRVAADDQQRGLQMERERVALAATRRLPGASNLGPAPAPVKASVAERSKPKKLKWKKSKEPKRSRSSA